MLDRTPRESTRLNQTGAALFVLWGVIHILIGASALVSFYTAGPIEMFAQAELTVEPQEMGATLEHVANIIAEYYFDLVALGILAIIVGVTLVWENDPLGFWINLIVLGIADFAFLFLEIVPGYQPLLPPVLGPIIYILAVIFTAAGLVRARKLSG